MTLHPAAAWAAAVTWAGLVILGLWMVPAAVVTTRAVAIALGLFVGAVLYAGLATAAGYHRSHQPVGRRLWHASPTDWMVGQVVHLDPSQCRAWSRMHSAAAFPLRRAVYVFPCNPTRGDVRFNRADATFVYELEVLQAPARHYRRLDGRAIAFTDPVQVRIARKRAARPQTSLR